MAALSKSAGAGAAVRPPTTCPRLVCLACVCVLQFSKVWIIFFGIDTLLLLSIGFVAFNSYDWEMCDLTNNTNLPRSMCEQAPITGVGFLAFLDYMWFICLAFTPILLPMAPALVIQQAKTETRWEMCKRMHLIHADENQKFIMTLEKTRKELEADLQRGVVSAFSPRASAKQAAGFKEAEAMPPPVPDAPAEAKDSKDKEEDKEFDDNLALRLA